MSEFTDEPLNVPYCFYPGGYSTYAFVNVRETGKGASAVYKLKSPSGYPGDVSNVRIDFTAETEQRLRVKVGALRFVEVSSEY
jgi:hypothetical protein